MRIIIQADIKTSCILGVYCLSAITIVTSQNSNKVSKLFNIPNHILESQLRASLDEYEINGTKMWITNAQYSDIAYIYTRTGPEKKNLTTFILEKNNNEFTVGKPIHKMGMRASPTGELVFDKSRVPFSARVGNEGDSTYHMMKNLEIERK